MQYYLTKIKYGIIISLSLCAIHTNAQIAHNLDKRLVYELKYQPDSTNSKSIESEFFYLDFSDSESIFRSESIHLTDSVINSPNPENLLGLRQQIPKTQFSYRIVKNTDQNEVTTYYDYLAIKLILPNEPISLNWEIQDNTKDILGHTCIEATTEFKGRTYIAYFTEAIPFSDGPYKFKGLPGMILELYDTKNHYHFKTVSIENLPKTYDYQLAFIDRYKKVSKKELHEFQDKIKEKPSLTLVNPNIQLPPEAHAITDRRGREKNKTRNNPIELSRE